MELVDWQGKFIDLTTLLISMDKRCAEKRLLILVRLFKVSKAAFIVMRMNGTQKALKVVELAIVLFLLGNLAAAQINSTDCG